LAWLSGRRGGVLTSIENKNIRLSGFLLLFSMEKALPAAFNLLVPLV